MHSDNAGSDSVHGKQAFLQKLLGLLAPSGLIVLNLFLFAPALIYGGNASEFRTSPVDIILLYSLPGIALWALLVVSGLLLPKGLLSKYRAILFTVGLLLWLQGNILVWKYGLFNGQGIDWATNSWRGWVDGSVWVLLLVLGVLLHNRLQKMLSFTSVVFIILQTILMGVTITKEPLLLRFRDSQSTLAKNELFEFSSKQNVIHLILDGFQSDIFHEIIEEDPDYYSGALGGFTYFTEATGSFPTTYMSVPAFLSGKIYKNDVPMSDFAKNVLSSNTILNTAYDSGYDVDLILTLGLTKEGKYTNSYIIPTPYGVSDRDQAKAEASLLADLVLFRVSPHFVKKYIYNNEAWLVQRLFDKDQRQVQRYFAHSAFLNDLVNKASVKRDKPVYKYIHLATTHPPVVVGEDCRFTGVALPLTRENVKAQDKCALDQVLLFLNRLKELGIYDSSLILIHADHGIGLPLHMRATSKDGAGNELSAILPEIAGSAMPLLLLKPPSSMGPLKFSGVPATLTDIPATMTDLLGLDGKFRGQSIFRIKSNESRQRKFYSYTFKHENWQSDYLDHIDEYIIDGSVLATDSWRLGRYMPSRDISFVSRKIDFGSEAASKYLRIGWSSNEQDAMGRTFNWATGKSASVLISLPKTGVQLTAEVSSPEFSDGPQIVDILVDGEKKGQWTISRPLAWRQYSVDIEADLRREAVSEVTFNFSKFLKASDEGKDKRPLAVRFDSLAVHETVQRPVYEWGSIIRFGKDGNATQYQGPGWSIPENGLTWTDGKRADLFFSTARGGGRDVVLRATLRALLHKGTLRRQKIYVTANNEPVATWIIKSPVFQERSLVIPKGVLKDGKLAVSFGIPDAVAPEKLGVNNDKRVLGLAFENMTMTVK